MAELWESVNDIANITWLDSPMERVSSWTSPRSLIPSTCSLSTSRSSLHSSGPLASNCLVPSSSSNGSIKFSNGNFYLLFIDPVWLTWLLYWTTGWCTETVLTGGSTKWKSLTTRRPSSQRFSSIDPLARRDPECHPDTRWPCRPPGTSSSTLSSNGSSKHRKWVRRWNSNRLIFCGAPSLSSRRWWSCRGCTSLPISPTSVSSVSSWVRFAFSYSNWTQILITIFSKFQVFPSLTKSTALPNGWTSSVASGCSSPPSLWPAQSELIGFCCWPEGTRPGPSARRTSGAPNASTSTSTRLRFTASPATVEPLSVSASAWLPGTFNELNIVHNWMLIVIFWKLTDFSAKRTAPISVECRRSPLWFWVLRWDTVRRWPTSPSPRRTNPSFTR